MQKATWKLRGLPHAADTVRQATSIRAAARALSVHPSTIARAVERGILPRPGTHRVPKHQAPKQDDETFLEWALRTYELNRAELELARLAQAALDMARNPTMSPALQLQAMAQYRAIVRELKLPDEATDGNAEKTTGRFPRPA